MIDFRAIEEKTFHVAEDLLQALDPACPEWGDDPSKWCFRGQDCDEPLIPTALRDSADGDASLLRRHPADRSSCDREFRAVRDFMRAADRSGLAIPHDGPAIRASHRLTQILYGRHGGVSDGKWPPDELLAIVALAQHYGVPTRLLDWTYRPHVAAYFAAAKLAMEIKGLAVRKRFQTDGSMVVWALNTSFLSCRGLVAGGDPPRLALVEAPQATNPNLAAQAGLFTLDRLARPGEGLEQTLPADWRQIFERLEQARARLPDGQLSDLLRPPVMFRKLLLPHMEAQRLLRLLGLRGINAATVFPGHKGVVDSMYERLCWEVGRAVFFR